MKTTIQLAVSAVAMVGTFCCICNVLVGCESDSSERQSIDEYIQSEGQSIDEYIQNDSLSEEIVHDVLETAAAANVTERGMKHVAVDLHWKVESGMPNSTFTDLMSCFGIDITSMNKATDYTNDYTFNVHLNFSNVSMNVSSENVDDETKEIIDAVTDLEHNDISDLVIFEGASLVGCDEIKYIVCDKSRVPCRFYDNNVTNVSKARNLALYEDTNEPTASEDSGANSFMDEAVILDDPGAEKRTNETIARGSSRRTWVWQHRRRRFDLNLGRVVGYATCYGGAAVHTYYVPQSAMFYTQPQGWAAMYACTESVRHGVNEIDGNGGSRRRSWISISSWFR